MKLDTLLLALVAAFWLSNFSVSSSNSGEEEEEEEDIVQGKTDHGGDDGNKMNRILRIPQTEFANYKRFLPCLDDMPSNLIPHVQDYRKKTREPIYSSLPCISQCFRAVLDGYANDDLSLSYSSSSSIEEIANQVEDIFYREELVSKEGGGGGIISSIKRKQTFSGRSAATSGQNPYEQFHMDYFEVADYVVTAILYLEPSDNLQGGETCFADSFINNTTTTTSSSNNDKEEKEEVQQQSRLEEGLIIEPKKGRLVLFSSGGENYHGPLPILRRDQERPTYIFFYKCREEEQEATEQQEEDTTTHPTATNYVEAEL